MTATATTTRPETLLQVRPGTTVSIAEGDPPAVLVAAPTWSQRISLPDAVLRDALCSLKDHPSSVAALAGGLRGAELKTIMALHTLVERLSEVGVFDHVVVDDGHTVARLTGAGTLPVPSPPSVPSGPWALTRFAVLTVEDGWAVAESGLTHRRVVLDPRLIPGLLSGDLVEANHWPEVGVAAVVHAAGLLVRPGSEDRREARQWNACDLWMHRRTAESRANDRYGGTYPLGPDVPPLPFGRDPAAALATVALTVPDLQLRAETEAPLVTVMEGRHSVRSFDTTRPPTADQLAELLYRTCRVRRSFRDSRGLEVVDRPYPSGGSIHEIEVYCGVTDCPPLTPGLYRYAADRHQLDLLAEDGPQVRRLIGDAQGSVGLDVPPPVVLVLTARFGRLMWKYETIAYGLILKNAGVLMQSVYLAATAMGLGTCALGGGSTSSFAAATGEDPLAEGVVGQLLVGVPAPEGEVCR